MTAAADDVLVIENGYVATADGSGPSTSVATSSSRGASPRSARRIGLRFHPTRGSMNLAASSGGLPPDSVVVDHDEILRASDAAIDPWHDPSGDAMLQIAPAPCSPFSVTGPLMRESAEPARRRGVRLHLLGREPDLGNLEVGKLADLALWRVDGLASIDIEDPVCALVFGNHTPLEVLVVNGRIVIDDGRLTTADVEALGRTAQRASRRIAGTAAPNTASLT